MEEEKKRKRHADKISLQIDYEKTIAEQNERKRQEKEAWNAYGQLQVSKIGKDLKIEEENFRWKQLLQKLHNSSSIPVIKETKTLSPLNQKQ